MLHSYPSIYNLGHAAIVSLFDEDVIVQEKVDGSQFSFGKIEGTLQARSKGQNQVLDAPDKMFARAIEVVKQLEPQLHEGWVYRGEYLQKPKHNALAYDRVPVGNIILFDINTGEETYLSPEEVSAEATRLGLESVPTLFIGRITQAATVLEDFLQRTSILGGQKIEGVVFKPRTYGIFGKDKKVLMGKFVSEAFKEVHKGEWQKANPSNLDIISELGVSYRTPARWNKAIQHLRERGELESSPTDIGKLLKEIAQDTLKECEDEIKERLFKYAWPKLQRIVCAGFPEWYKQQLLERQFENVGT